jgi:hypothetical protein
MNAHFLVAAAADKLAKTGASHSPPKVKPEEAAEVRIALSSFVFL